MKSTWFLPSIVLALSIVIASFLLSQAPSGYVERTRSVMVKGLAEKEVKADLAIWSADVRLTGNNLPAIKNKLNEQVESVKSFFKEQGVAENEWIQGMTTINDRYDDYGGTRDRYTVKASFTLRMSDIPKLQKIIVTSDKLLEKGILFTSNPYDWTQPVQYIFTKLNEIKPQMIEEATRNAREAAQKFAHDSESRLGKIKFANQGVFSINDLNAGTPEVKLIRVVSSIEYFLQD